MLLRRVKSKKSRIRARESSLHTLSVSQPVVDVFSEFLEKNWSEQWKCSRLVLRFSSQKGASEKGKARCVYRGVPRQPRSAYSREQKGQRRTDSPASATGNRATEGLPCFRAQLRTLGLICAFEIVKSKLFRNSA